MSKPVKVTKAVIAAAGFGTRFLPQTKAMPKEMLPIVDKPVIQYLVEDLVEAGIKDIIIVGSSSKRAIISMHQTKICSQIFVLVAPKRRTTFKRWKQLQTWRTLYISAKRVRMATLHRLRTPPIFLVMSRLCIFSPTTS